MAIQLHVRPAPAITRSRGSRAGVVLAAALAACSGGSGGSKEQPGAPDAAHAARRAGDAAEVAAIFAELRVREEAYRLELGAYLATGAEGTYWPPTPDAKTTELPDPWKQLGVRLPTPLHCQYVVVAGPAGTADGTGPIGRELYPTPPTTSWYYLLGRCEEGGRIYLTRSDRTEVQVREP